jgi:hypothetical protein
MSVDKKIKALLEKVDRKQDLQESEEEVVEAAGPMGASGVSKDTSLKPANSGDASMPRQGSSQDAPYDERDEKEPNQGAIASKTVGKNTIAAKSTPGDAPNFTTVADPTSAVNQSNSKGNVAKEEAETDEEEMIAEEEIVEEEEIQAIDLSPIFGEGLSEEFKDKATSIFEAAVIARVNSEMGKVTAALEEQFENQIAEAKEAMVEKIDSYLNYVVENWMAENELAIENGLRTEIAEDFISGLKVLFKEHYIEVPEEKYDVIGEMSDKIAALEERLNETISENADLSSYVVELKREAVIREVSEELADTEAAKLEKLLEGVDFESEELYREKVRVIKENYFPKNSAKQSKDVQPQSLIEDMSQQQPDNTVEASSTVAAYAQALSRTIRK